MVPPTCKALPLPGWRYTTSLSILDNPNHCILHKIKTARLSSLQSVESGKQRSCLKRNVTPFNYCREERDVERTARVIIREA